MSSVTHVLTEMKHVFQAMGGERCSPLGKITLSLLPSTSATCGVNRATVQPQQQLLLMLGR
jgi:hypothetical protein